MSIRRRGERGGLNGSIDAGSQPPLTGQHIRHFLETRRVQRVVTERCSDKIGPAVGGLISRVDQRGLGELSFMGVKKKKEHGHQIERFINMCGERNG
ncbi:hypothetical protein NPIL_306531 [Nephila pilipes]|uniref:Uncharacterized protein n=1 Tax=Nephila pilipes TaxID=299642 RepID=A0A8X6PSH7_NEPPI|nr:hypothetical protein NPIL_306531 [Nephila pilipes]